MASMAERVSELGDRARERKMESRLDKLDRENDRLRQEVRLLKDDLHEERGSLQQALDALKRDEHVTVQTKAPKRRSRIMRTIVIGGGAYVLGTRAGRERYDQIVEKTRSLGSKAQGRMNRGSSSESPSWEAGQTGSPTSTI